MNLIKVTIPQKKIDAIHEYAEKSYGEYYKRFDYDEKNRIERVFYGKIGEEAVAMKLHTEVNYEPGTNSGYDLVWHKKRIAVKTKKVKKIPRRWNDYYVHIPEDQYSKILRSADILIGTFAEIPDVYIIGWLLMDDVDKLKEFHNEERLRSIGLPPIPSWGIDVKNFKPLSSLFWIGG